MPKKKLTAEQEAANVSVTFRMDAMPAPGYITSVVIRNTGRGPLVTFVGVGLAPAPLDGHASKFPWYSDTSAVTTGLNEAGVTSRILHQVRFTDLKHEAVEQLRAGGESGYLPLDIAVEQLKEGLTGRTQIRDDRFKANLAAAYLEQIRETGPRGVYDVLGPKLDYAPSTLRSYVKQIRDQGFLTPAVPGVAGGDLTDKSRGILGLESSGA